MSFCRSSWQRVATLLPYGGHLCHLYGYACDVQRVLVGGESSVVIAVVCTFCLSGGDRDRAIDQALCLSSGLSVVSRVLVEGDVKFCGTMKCTRVSSKLCLTSLSRNPHHRGK